MGGGSSAPPPQPQPTVPVPSAADEEAANERARLYSLLRSRRGARGLAYRPSLRASLLKSPAAAVAVAAESMGGYPSPPYDPYSGGGGSGGTGAGDTGGGDNGGGSGSDTSSSDSGNAW